MAEENNTEEVETEEKSLEDQLAALEEVAASLGDDTEIKSDDAEEESEEESEEASEEAPEEEASEEAPEEEASEETSEEVEEKEASTEEVDEKAATLTGFPHDRVVLDDEEQEDDSEPLMKPPGGVEDAKGHGDSPKKRVVVVEMAPEDITEDMKAYVVEVDDDAKASINMVPEEEDVPVRPVMEEEAPRPVTPVAAAVNAPPLVEEEDDDEDGKGWGKPGKNRLARLMALANGDEEEAEEEEDEKQSVPLFPTAILVGKEEEAPLPIDTLDQEVLEKRLERLGTDTKSLRDDSFLCSIERTIRSGDVCNFCRGGCASEKGLPGLLEVEVKAEKEFKGEVIDSGYAPKDDIFVLDLKTDDGIVEAYYAGAGTQLGWIKIDPDVEVKSADQEDRIIVSFNEAEVVALKNVEGKSLGVDVDIFQGQDAYVVEIDGLDGKSYDAYVSVDGQFLGSDMIELTEEEEAELKELRDAKESIEAEIRLKTSYSKEALEDLVKDGMAMEDGSYPIVSTEDLENAVVAAMHEKSQDIKDHITKRATEMEKIDLLPELWAEEKAAFEAELTAALMEMEMMEIETDIADTE